MKDSKSKSLFAVVCQFLLPVVVVMAFTSNGFARQSVDTSIISKNSPASFDINGDQRSDLAWKNSLSGLITGWEMDGTSVINNSLLSTDPTLVFASRADLNGDGKADLIWYNSQGQTVAWLMDGPNPIRQSVLSADPNWRIEAIADLNGDRNDDLVWKNSATGQTALWLMSGTDVIASSILPIDSRWNIGLVGDFNADGKDDLLWRLNSTGETVLWIMNGLLTAQTAILSYDSSATFIAADLNGDHKQDLIWRDGTGQTTVWLMDGVSISAVSTILSDPGWSVVLTGDFSGDGNDDLVWYNPEFGATSMWLMSGIYPIANNLLLIDPNFRPWATGDFNGDHKADLLWFNPNSGETNLWLMNGTTPYSITTLLRDPESYVIRGSIAATITVSGGEPQQNSGAATDNYGDSNLPPAPVVSSAPPAGKTFYIDWVDGKDTNDGLTKNTPWKRAPGMQGTLAGIGPGYFATTTNGGICNNTGCDLSGYSFVFKGGVTWPQDAFQWIIGTHGTGYGASSVYYGVDTTWYAGSSWSRPILDFGRTNGPVCQMMVLFAPVGYVVFDNFEFTNLYWDSRCGSGTLKMVGYLAPNIGGHNEFKNLYMHGWAHDTYANGTGDQCHLVWGDTQGVDSTSTLHDSVIDGSDVDNSMGNSCVGFFGGPPIVYNNYFSYLDNGGVSSMAVSFYQNTCDHIGWAFDPTAHDQCFLSNADHGMLIYNNLIRHVQTGLVMEMEPIAGYTTYFFNNVLYDIGTSGNGVNCNHPANQSYGGTCNYLQNTMEHSSSSAYLIACATDLDGCVYRNNHFIGPQAVDTYCLASQHCVNDHNTLQSLSIANSQGYSSSTLYPYSPTSANGATVGSGVDLSAICSGVLAPLCSAIPAGVEHDEIGHTVIVPNASSQLRPATPDTGAYQMNTR